MDPHIERASLLLRQGRVNDAITQLKNALQQNPDNHEALSMYARCFFDKKEFEEGIKILQQAIAIDPDNHYYFYLLAFAFYRKHMNAAAVDNLQKSIQLNPFFAEAYGLFSLTLCEEKDFEKALQKANEGLTVDSENITCLNGRSVALNKLRRVDDAVETMQFALKQDPDNEFTHSTAGWNYLEKGNNKMAATHFKEALRINPNNNNARQGLKESLKSIIPPYRWLLQYNFWINNKGKKARWAIPLGMYFGVRVFSAALQSNNTTNTIGTVLIGLYVLFALTTWLIYPLANFFLLFHKDGKYAVNTTERWTAITVVCSLAAGSILFCIGMLNGSANIFQNFLVAAIAFLAMALPLGNIQYPLSFNGYAGANKVAMTLVALGLVTIVFSFINLNIATVTGLVLIVSIVINSWVSIFRK
jgi:tetratricopeptide (TPR) repeat protein